MKTVFYIFLALFLSENTFSQTEMISSATVGAQIDIVNEPVVVQAEYSRSQTLYYPEDLAFRGTINTIKFFTEFSGSSFANSTTWRVKIGVTDKAEFTPGDSFIADSELTEVFNGTISYSGLTVTLTLTQPFYYNGQQNMVIDVQELDPGKSTSALTGFQGVEHFNNPPTRTRMTLTNGSTTNVLYENSYAKTQFLGSLERCGLVYQGTFTNLSPTSVLANWPNPINIPAFRYNINIVGQPAPATYQVVAGNSVQLDNLQPATVYSLNRKADCDITPTMYGGQQFITDPYSITVPTIITFDGPNTFNYFLPPRYRVASALSPDAAVNSENGILFRGANDSALANAWSSSTTNPWVDNASFISSAVFFIDLTNYTGNPVFQFDLRQTNESKFRVKINELPTENVYTSTTPNADGFKTVTIDLSDKIGTKFNLVMENLGRYTTAAFPYSTAFVDNVKLIEAVCLPPQNTIITNTENSITLAWASPADEWEVTWNNHDLTPSNSGTITNTGPFTISGLLPAKSYDIYIRSKCGSSYSSWKKIIKSTKPATVQVPYQQTFSALTTNYAPEFHDSSRHTNYSGRLIMYQKYNDYTWVGGTTTTEQQAWNDNKPFSSGITFRVDATNLSSLNLAVNLKQQFFYSQKTSWFRVLVNGIQFGASRNPSSMSSDAYQTVNYDLTQFTGSIIEVTLEHCGKSTENFSDGSVMDITRISNVQFTGQVLGTEDFQKETALRIFPNPSSNQVNFSHSETIEEITVSDLNGKTLIAHKPKEVTRETALDIASLSAGIYIAKVKSNGNYLHAKIIRQ